MTQNGETEVSMPPTPTVIVYQNADFVSGLLQEIYQKGILEAIETESRALSSSNDEETGTVEGSIEGEFKKFGFGSRGKAVAKYVKGQIANDENVVGNRQKFVFSQAFYLDRVRAELRNRSQIRVIHSVEEADTIEVGEFIEFEAKFAANEANALLDILTPELTAAIARFSQKREASEEIDQVSQEFQRRGKSINMQRIEEINAAHEIKAGNQAEFAAAVTAAIRADFRGDKTIEFYATIGQEDESFTAVTVCETEHFVSQDSDRLLDGRFTVLAKVITGARENVSVLAKNKLLHRIKLETLEGFLRAFANNAAKQAEEYVDLSFQAKIEGKSITVLPIAIYV